MQTQTIPQVLTIDTAAKMYAGTALTPAAIRRLVRSGEIPSRKVGAKYLIVASAIEEWLQGDPQTAKTVQTSGGGRAVMG